MDSRHESLSECGDPFRCDHPLLDRPSPLGWERINLTATTDSSANPQGCRSVIGSVRPVARCELRALGRECGEVCTKYSREEAVFLDARGADDFAESDARQRSDDDVLR